MENETLWMLVREEGKTILAQPKYTEKLKELETVVRNSKANAKGFKFNEKWARTIRADILLRQSQFVDLESGEHYAEAYLDDFKGLTVKELEWLDHWSVSYLVACNGDIEAEGIAGYPDGVQDGDYVQYYLVGGMPPDDWKTKYPDTPYCILFAFVASIRRKIEKEVKTTLIREYLKVHPDGDGYLNQNKIPPSFSEISGQVELYELTTFWRNHRYNPRMARKATKVVWDEYTKRNGTTPTAGADTEKIVTELGYSALEDRVAASVSKKAKEHLFRTMYKEMKENDKLGLGETAVVNYTDPLRATALLLEKSRIEDYSHLNGMDTEHWHEDLEPRLKQIEDELDSLEIRPILSEHDKKILEEGLH